MIAAIQLDVCCNHDNHHNASEVQKLMEALSNNGFIQLINHGVSANMVSCTMGCSREFFHSPQTVKLGHVSKDKARRGYSPMATENFATLIGESGKPNDTVEKYRIGPDVSAVDRELHDSYYNSKEAKLHFFPNDWSNLPAEFESHLTAYYAAMYALSQRIMSVLERAVGLEEGYFAACTDKHTSILSLNHYPPLARVSNSTSGDGSVQTRVAEHTDVSVITIVAQSILCDSVSGDYTGSNSSGNLEVYDTKTNTWLSVPYTPGAFIVNVGDCLSDWSRGYFKSSRHRVVLSDAQNATTPPERYSLAYFFAPNYDTVLNWPVAEDTAMVNEDNKDLNLDPAVTYTVWRKNKIKRAISQLKN